MTSVVIRRLSTNPVQVKVSVSSVRINQSGGGGDGGPPFQHIQNSASVEWVINHNLGFRPLVSVLNPGGSEIEAEIVHVSNTQLRINFNQPQAGSAIVR